MAKRPPLNPVSLDAADRFEAFVRKWQRLLNLEDWRVERSSKQAAYNMAELSKLDLQARLATYKLGKDFGAAKVTDQSLESTALHEMLHVLLFELIETAKEAQTVTTDHLQGVEHRVVHVLERLLMERKP